MYQGYMNLYSQSSVVYFDPTTINFGLVVFELCCIDEFRRQPIRFHANTLNINFQFAKSAWMYFHRKSKTRFITTDLLWNI